MRLGTVVVATKEVLQDCAKRKSISQCLYSAITKLIILTYSYFQNKWPRATCALHILHEKFEKSSILRVPPEPSDACM